MVDKSEKFRWLIRLGFAARGLVYLLIGYLALVGAGGDGGPEGAFSHIREVPLGVPLLHLSALGLLGYALYRLCSLLFDIDGFGTDANGVAHRIGHGASSVAHLMFAYTAFQMAQGGRSGGTGAQEAAGTLVSFPFGSLVLGMVGIGFLAAAAMQARKAYTGEFMRRVASSAPAFVETLGRAGYAARAVVFLIIAWSLVQSAWLSNTAQVKTLGDAVASLSDAGAWYTVVALGLLLFGAFSLFLARYRVVPDLDRAAMRPRVL